MRVRSVVPTAALRALMRESWPDERSDDWSAVLARSLTWVCAYEGPRLVGFVNVAWDGGQHAFLLDSTVHPSVRRRGIGTALVRLAVEASKNAGATWLHVDYEPALARFYEQCGFHPTAAGLQRL